MALLNGAKRGITYVDWAISFGLFLITVILIIILIRPQIETTYDKEDLLSLVEHAFMENMSWQVKRVPVFIDKLQPFSPNPTFIKISFSPSAHLEYNLTPNYARISNSPLTLQCTGATTNACSPASFFLYASPLSGTEATPGLHLACDPPDPAVCSALLGATETFYGLNEKEIRAFKALSYEEQKKALNLPESVDAAIFLDAEQLTNNDEPPLQTNVYVREIKTWMLDTTAHTTPVVVRMKVWR